LLQDYKGSASRKSRTKMHHRKGYILAQICPESNSLLMNYLDFFTISVCYSNNSEICDNLTHNSNSNSNNSNNNNNNNNLILIYERASLTVQCSITKVAQSSKYNII